MPAPTPPPTTPRNPRRIARYLLLLLVPLAVLLHTCGSEVEAPRDLPAFSFSRPPAWTYLTETSVKPADGRIRFSAAALADAFEHGHLAPLFALTKYPPPHRGLNPIIGVNLAWATTEDPPSPTKLLERSVAEVQASSGDRLAIIEETVATHIAGLPAARVVLGTRGAPAADKVADKLIVLAIVSERLSFMIAASGAFEGTDAIDAVLRDFAGSLVVERP